MIELFLDNTQLEVPQDIGIGLSLGIADYTDPITASGAYTQTIEIPRTPHNDKVFNFSGEILSNEQFNNAEHTARVLQDGCELVGGKAYLEGASLQSYRLQIVGAEIDWVANIRDKKLSELEGDVIGTFRPSEWDEYDGEFPESFPALSFVLLDHGCWWQETEEDNTRRSWVTYNDLIPIVKLHTLLSQLFRGYDIEVSDKLRRMLHITYCSMQWRAEEKASVYAEDYDFELTSNLLNADSEGELSVNVGSYMPLFDTIVEDKSGRLVDVGSSIEFTPDQDLTVSLELKTKYQTTISTHPTEIYDDGNYWDDVEQYTHTFADQLYQVGEDWPFVQYDLKDSLEWASREELKADSNYKPVYGSWTDSGVPTEVLDPANMALCYVEVDNPENYQSIGYVCRYQRAGAGFIKEYRPTITQVSKAQIVRTNYSNVRDDKNGYVLYIYPALRGKDGKLYIYSKPNVADFIDDVEAKGVSVYGLSTDQRLTFDVALKMPTRRYQSGVTYDVSHLRFKCSAYDKDITVYGTAEGSLKTKFEYGVPIHENVKISDIGGDATADNILRSIIQMYNLLIYTNPYTKKVHLYSFDEFWRGDVVDWSGRIDSDSEISVAHLADSIGKEVLLSYADGSPRIDHYNERNTLPYFAYKTTLPTKMTNEAKEVQNALFSPAFMVKVADAFGSGSGYIPALAPKDSENTVLDFNLADVPMTAMLIDTQSTPPTLPLNRAVFGDMGNIQPPIVATMDFTLSFADKEGAIGMHQFYDRQIDLWRKGKRLTCYCQIEAWEIEALRTNDDNLNFRSLFKLNINGEYIYARLESVEYEPTNTTNKCTFIIE